MLPQIIPVPGIRPSECPVAEPGAGRLNTYPVPGADGLYAAYGDRRLLPVSIDVQVGEEPHSHGIDQLLFGAQTTFTLPSTVRLFDRPHAVESLGVPRQPMAVLYGGTTDWGAVVGTITYRVPLTASVWEIAGRQEPGQPQPVACLYFSKQPH